VRGSLHRAAQLAPDRLRVVSLTGTHANPNYNLLQVDTSSNTMFRLRGDGDTIWRSIGVADAGTDLLFEKANVDGSGAPQKVANGDVIRCVIVAFRAHPATFNLCLTWQ
jgi:hypothetical protein